MGDSIYSYRCSRWDSHGHVGHLDTPHLDQYHVWPGSTCTPAGTATRGRSWCGSLGWPHTHLLPGCPAGPVAASLVESCLPHLISGLCKTTSNWCSGFLGFSLNELVFFFFKDTYFYLFIGPHQILIAACKLLVVACGSGSLTRNRTWAPLYWEHRVSGTGQQGSPLVYFCWVLCSGNLSLSSGCLCVCVCVCVCVQLCIE